MDVLNFGHGVFIALGAFVATSVMGGMADWSSADSLARNLVAVGCSRDARRDDRRRLLGLAFERVIVRPVYGPHLKQILITMGGMIVGEELIKVVWGPQIPLPLPTTLRGSFVVGDASIEKYRVLAVVIGPSSSGCCCWGAQPHQDRPAHPRRRPGPRDGRGAGLPHPAPVRRRVRRRLGAGRPGRRDVGACTSRRSCRRSAPRSS